MPDYAALKKKVDELAERVWDFPAIEARIRKMSAEGIPKKKLDPKEMLANKEQILDRVQLRGEEYNLIFKNCAQGTALALMEAGFEVHSASSLMEFDKVLSTVKPDIILTDIKMPEISGDNICRVLKKKMQTKLIPIVLFSTLEDKELAELADRAGADGYVCKNAGVEEIVKRVKSLTEEILF